MGHRKHISLLAAALLLPWPGFAADSVSPDLSRWSCRHCPALSGADSHLEIGLLAVSETSFRFGDYRGLGQDGEFWTGNAELNFLNEKAGYFRLVATDLGLDANAVSLRGGQFGSASLALDYQQIPHLLGDTTVTPFIEAPDQRLSLPANWEPAASTREMPRLRDSLMSRPIGHRREQLFAGLALSPGASWDVDVQLRRQTRQGRRWLAGSFINSAALLPGSLDQVTDELEARIGRGGRSWRSELSYYGSSFRNGNNAQVWDNPFTPIVDGARRGRLALAPDNQYHTLSLTLGLHPGRRLRVNGTVSIGRNEQDQNFVAASENPSLRVDLPRSSLRGRVDSSAFRCGLLYAPLPRLSLKADYLFDERDNRTPVASWTPVLADVTTLSPRQNLPYSFTRHRARASVRLRLTRGANLSLGVENDFRRRSHQRVRESQDQGGWVGLKLRAGRRANFDLRLASTERQASGRASVPGLTPPENELLHQTHLAERTRDEASARLRLRLDSRALFSLHLNLARDDYPAGRVGLNSVESSNAGVSLSVSPQSRWTGNLFLSLITRATQQSNSARFATPDWQGISDDRLVAFGLGLAGRELGGWIDLDIDYGNTLAAGDTRVETGSSNLPQFPELQSDLQLFKLQLGLRLHPALSLRLAYWSEIWDISDWTMDAVGVDTLSNVLAHGQRSGEGRVSLFSAALRYAF